MGMFSPFFCPHHLSAKTCIPQANMFPAGCETLAEKWWAEKSAKRRSSSSMAARFRRDLIVAQFAGFGETRLH
jgi:hypothetical protein